MLREKLIKLIGLLFLWSFLCNTTALATGKVNIIGSIYFLFLVIIIGLIYNHVTAQRYQKQFVFSSAIFAVFAVSNLLFFQKDGINSYSKLFGSFIIIVYCVFYFYRLMKELPTVHVQRLPMFWFNSAFLLFHAGTFFQFAFTSYLIHVLNDNLLIYGSFHNILSIIQQLIVFVGVSYSLKNLNRQADNLPTFNGIK